MDFTDNEINLTKYDQDYITLYSNYLLTGDSNAILRNLEKLAEFGHPDSIALLNIISQKKIENKKIIDHLDYFVILDVHGMAGISEKLAVITMDYMNKDKNIYGSTFKSEIGKLIREINNEKYNPLKSEFALELANLNLDNEYIDKNLSYVRNSLLYKDARKLTKSTQYCFAIAKNLVLFDSSKMAKKLGENILKDLSSRRLNIIENNEKE